MALLVAHYAILRVRHGAAPGSVNPIEASWHMTAGRVSLLIFLIITVSSLWRIKPGIDYDRWRIRHGLLAVTAVILAIFHIEGAGYYTRAPWTTWPGKSSCGK